MKARGLVILSVTLGMLFASTLLYAEEKMAYVELLQVFDEYSKTKEYDKVLEKKQEDYQKAREDKLEGVKKLQEKLSLLSEEERESRKGELESLITQLQEFDRDKTQDLRKQRDDKIQEIFKDINKVISDYAKKNGITLVFDKRALVYQSEKLDITKQILEMLNKK
ncbi:MAG: OmpH family outer membrane protein [Candidatus Omnitrophota bacterium]|jgi:outer membrane protein